MKRSLAQFLFVLVLLAPLSTGAVEPNGNAQRGIVYDFGASWCTPCQQIAPLVNRLKREGLPIRKVDIDQERELADRFRIQRVPTFVLVIDGKEVLRKRGALSETALREMMAQIPDNQAAPSSMEIPVDLGAPGQMPRPRTLPMHSDTRIGETEDQREGVWPFNLRNRKRDAPQVLRGNDTELGTPGPFGTPEPKLLTGLDPMLASVRIRVIIGDKINAGSGTIISSAPGNTSILTCGHIFRDFSDDAKIEVEIFQTGQSKSYIARLQKFDLESDLGLISVPTDVALKAIPLPDSNGLPEIADPVASIGCSGGADPTRRQLRVTAINKYEGPNNIECTGLPVQGRSGGGLFNQKGELVGVCIAADKEGQRGLYSGLLAVHQLLDECNMTALYQQSPPANSANPFESSLSPLASHEQPASLLEFEMGDTPIDLHNNPVVLETPDNGSNIASPTHVEAGHAEVVVLIRDKSQPDAPNRVIIIHDASSKFLSYLNGELPQGQPARPLTKINRPQRSIAASHAPSRSTSSIPASSLKSQLIPTALSTPVIPKRYTRSASR